MFHRRHLFPLLLLFLKTAHTQPTFQKLDTLAFLDAASYLNGVSWVDVDNDYDLDVCVTGIAGAFPNFTSANKVYINQGNNYFVPAASPVSIQKDAMRHGWADIDNDGDLDAYFGATWNNNGLNELWENNGAGTFSKVSNSGATPATPQPFEGTVSWGDYDNDGAADLFLARWNDSRNRLFHNNGDGTFAEITTGALVADQAWTSGGFWGDYDNDRDLDMYVVDYQTGASAKGVNDLFRNNGDGTFTKLTGLGLVVADQQNSRSANWVDADNNGFLDLFVCNQFGQDMLFLNFGNDNFFSKPVGDPNHTSWSSNWGDYDNDGDQDLLTIGFWNTDSRFWQNDGQGNFTDLSGQFFEDFPLQTNGSNSNGVIFVDYNADGWLDIHITQPDQSPDLFLKNEGLDCKSWLDIKLRGIESNQAAIGATIRAKAVVGGVARWQMRQVSAQSAATGINPLWQHLGFDEAAVIDSLVIEWPSGATCVFEQFEPNRLVEIAEDCSVQVIVDNHTTTGSKAYVSLVCQLSTTFFPVEVGGGSWWADCGACVDQEGNFYPAGLDTTLLYTVLYTQGGICGAIDTFPVKVIGDPEIEATGDTTVFAGELAPLSVTGANLYQWTPEAGLGCPLCANTVFTADTTTTFVVRGINGLLCEDTDSVTVTVLIKPEFHLPNAFTPNGDDSNDVFRPAYKGDFFVEYELTVYSRWGEIVYETTTPGQGWDGRINGIEAASDVYIYTFKYRFNDEQSGSEKGEVTLLR